MKFSDRLRFLFSGKASAPRIAVAQIQAGIPQSTPVNYEGFSKQGYQKNIYAYRSIGLVAKSCSGIKWELYQKRSGGKPQQIENHPVLTLLEKPNPLMPQATFFENIISYLMIAGNSYIEKVPETGFPLELWPLRPDQMRVVPAKNGYIGQYIWKAGMVEKVWQVDPIKLSSPICHLKFFHPTNIYYGMSPLEAACLSLDQNNSASTWNLSLLQNAATPSGVLQARVTDGNPSGALTDEQYEKLKQEFYSSFVGSKNAARPLILEGGLEWKQMSWNPKDMEFMNSKSVTAQELCTAFGVPPMMLGLGEMTYSNYAEARESFYEETVLPLMDFVRDYLNLWLIPMFGEGLYLDYDRDDIEALQGKKDKKRQGLMNASWLTVNEKRQADGYEPLEGWDVLVIGSQIVDNPSEVEEESEEMSDEQNESGEMDDETEEEPEESEAETEAEGEKGFKAINLINGREKHQSWFRQNAMRERLAKTFKNDVKEDLSDMYKDMAKKAKGQDAKAIEFAVLREMEQHLPVIEKTLKRHIKRATNEFGEMILINAKSEFGISIMETKANLKFDSFVERYIEQRAGRSITEIEGTTKKQVIKKVRDAVQRAIAEGNTTFDLTKDLQEEFLGLTDSRASLIARTEVAMASTQGSLEAVKSLGIPNMMKEWVPVEDDRTRDGDGPNLGSGPDHLSMKGTLVPLDESFTVPPDATMNGPGDPSGGADQVCNCRCVLVYKRGREE